MIGDEPNPPDQKSLPPGVVSYVGVIPHYAVMDSVLPSLLGASEPPASEYDVTLRRSD